MYKLLIRGIILISTAILALSVFSYSQRKDIGEQDGTDWISDSNYTTATNIGFIKGIIAGTSVIHDEIYAELDRLSKNKSIGTLDKSNIDRIMETVQNLSLYEITVGQIKDGVDALYKDFSNRRIKIIDAVYVVKMQIEGKDPDLIQAQIRYLRMQPLNPTGFEDAINKITNLLFERVEKNDFNLDFTNDDIKKGVVTEQDLLFYGIYVDKSNVNHKLFRYCRYSQRSNAN